MVYCFKDRNEIAESREKVLFLKSKEMFRFEIFRQDETRYIQGLSKKS